MKGFFKWSCLGCVGIVVLIGIVLAAISGIAWVGAKNEQVEDRKLERPLPTPEPLASGELAAAIPAGGAGRVILDLASGEFSIRAAEPGEPFQVDASFDTNTYELVETYEEGTAEAPWTYRIEFRQKASGLIIGLRSLFGASSPEVHVSLPLGVPIALQTTLTAAGAEVDLGALWLTSVEFDVSKAGLELEVDRPLLAPADRFAVRGRMCGIQLSSLGNASPRELSVDTRMSGAEIDLRGEWRNDSTIEIHQSMAGGMVRLPRDVEIRGLSADRIRVREVDEEIGAPVLTFIVSDDKGELEFVQ